MTIITIIKDQPISIISGTNDIGPFNIPDNLTGVEFRIKRATSITPLLWSSSTTTMQWTIQSSYDGGITWKFEAGTGVIAGGIRLNGIEEVAEDFFILNGLLPGIGRQFKATCIVVNGPLISQVSVNVF